MKKRTPTGWHKEHVEFQKWVHSLNRYQLLCAMECSLLDDGYSNSHEYDLLREMVSLQPALPTPIHPRATGYCRGATCKGATDGRNESARVLRQRFIKPRMFQLYERRSISFTRGSGGDRAQRKRYDIIAKTCKTPWGDTLNPGCTKEQLEADEKILTGTYVDSCHGIEKNGRTYLSFRSIVGTTHNNNLHATSHTASSILRMLHISSRGSFLSLPYQSSSPNHKKTPFFCAPWLDPTNRWFSLPLYLSSRFEVALWEAFHNQRRTVPLPRNRLWLGLQKKMPADTIVLSIQKSLRDAISQEVLPRDKAAALEKHTRDGILFDLFDSREDIVHWINCFWPQQPRHEWSDFNLSVEHLIGSLSYSPLVELGSTTDQLRLFLRRHWQISLQVEMEKQLIQTLDGDPVAPPVSNRRSRKKAKKKRKKTSKKRVDQQRADILANRKQCEHIEENVDSSDEESDCGGPRLPLVGSHPHGTRLSFPENSTPFVERNRNIILCLSTLNDIINDVFVRVGLDVSDEESDGPAGWSQNPKKMQTVPSTESSTAASSDSQQHSHFPSSKPAPTNNRNDNSQSREPHSYISGEEKKSSLSPDVEEFFPSQFHHQPDLGPGDFPVDTFPTQNCFPPGFFHRFSHPFGLHNPWEVQDNAGDGWGVSNRFQTRERSILAEFFLEQEYANANREERVIASSTAASLASSTDKNNEETSSLNDKFFISLDNESEALASDVASIKELGPEEFPGLDIYKEDSIVKQDSSSGPLVDHGQECDISNFETQLVSSSVNVKGDDSKDNPDSFCGSRSLSPEVPATPSPRLSPILLSLDDIKDIRNKGAESVGKLSVGASLSIPTSLPSSPVDQTKRRLTNSFSREDLRLKSFDDNGFVRKGTVPLIKRPAGGTISYRNVAAKGLKNMVSSTRAQSSDISMKARDACTRSETAEDGRDDSQNSGSMLSYRNVAAKSVMSNPGPSDLSWNPNWSAPESARKENGVEELCARSETAAEAQDDYQNNWHESRRSQEDNNNDNITLGKDGSTTITSAMSHRESEETSLLREERNTFRDMCLTLGAEVAKLKNQLAAMKGAALYPAIEYSQGYGHPLYGAGSFDPECMPPFFQKGQAPGAMSDAGIHRAEYESQVSEDDDAFPKITKTESGRHLGSGATIAGSDISAEHAATNVVHQTPLGLPVPLNRDPHDAGTVSGLQSRLTKDIMRFLAANDTQNRKLDKTRNLAVERISRLVNALWPRAQVKLYGSHVTGLNLAQSSDLDFVICLPAVHKNAPAVAPGVLEGRNAINETSQKLLARKLKQESWVGTSHNIPWCRKCTEMMLILSF